MKSWLNNRLLERDAVRIDPSDRGFTLGDGVFETIRILGGHAIRLDQHVARLRNGASVLGIRVPYDDAVLQTAIKTVTAVNDVWEGVVRLTLSRGPADRGIATPAIVAPTLLIGAQSMRPPTSPLRLITARSTCRNEHSLLSRIKSLSYLDGIIARREAEACGFDDAVMLNTVGLVAETTVATLLAFANDRFWTPPIGDGALPGISRSTFLKADLATERQIDQDWLGQAEAVFVCNSLGVRPVACLDEQRFMSRPELLERLSMTLSVHSH